MGIQVGLTAYHLPSILCGWVLLFPMGILAKAFCQGQVSQRTFLLLRADSVIWLAVRSSWMMVILENYFLSLLLLLLANMKLHALDYLYITKVLQTNYYSISLGEIFSEEIYLDSVDVSLQNK